ncbi:MAG: response regulator [Patescibacteria group bacterium]|nr:response regulator [Patescibacteria group bacterium]MDE2015798.1 response regulator [Patescibacteria group bacterium]MDE2227173.1 response regulator [Patescibacteria group bacterium]
MPEPKLILIVDDEPDFREIFSTKLSSLGYRTETAANGEEGVKKAKVLKPDLILMDVKMPKMGGAEAVLALRNDPDTKDIKAVFLTSLGDPRAEMQEINRKFSSEFGAQGYIKKTDDLDSIMEKIQAFLQ